jgi:hypothetical protein
MCFCTVIACDRKVNSESLNSEVQRQKYRQIELSATLPGALGDDCLSVPRNWISFETRKVNVNFSLCLIKHDAIKTDVRLEV